MVDLPQRRLEPLNLVGGLAKVSATVDKPIILGPIPQALRQRVTNDCHHRRHSPAPSQTTQVCNWPFTPTNHPAPLH
jgi:hypothetical protein